MISDHDQEIIQMTAADGIEAVEDGDLGAALEAFKSIQRRASNGEINE